MGLTNYLLDSNVVIYFLDGALPEDGHQLVAEIVNRHYYISVITEIEIKSNRNLADEDEILLEKFCRDAEVLNINKDIVQQTIQLRKKYRLKTPDAIIAASAIIQEFTLVTRNMKDFEQIQALSIVNPFEL